LASTSLAFNPDLFQQLLNAGVSANGTCNSAVRPLDAVLTLKQAAETKVPLICSLSLKEGCKTWKMSAHQRQEGTTIIHKVTDIALETGKYCVVLLHCHALNRCCYTRKMYMVPLIVMM